MRLMSDEAHIPIRGQDLEGELKCVMDCIHKRHLLLWSALPSHLDQDAWHLYLLQPFRQCALTFY